MEEHGDQVKVLVEDILSDMAQPDYVPVEAEALVLIAWQLGRIADALSKS